MPYPWPPTLTDVVDNLNLTDSDDDVELETVIDRATSILENAQAWRVLDHVRQTTYTDEEHVVSGPVVYLDHYPVVSVSSVTENTPTAQVIAAEPWGTTGYTGYGYRLDSASGKLTRLSGGLAYPWQGTILVTYTAGSATVPADLWGAALDLVDHLWKSQRGDAGPGLAEPDVSSFTDERLIPPNVREVLDLAYRKAPAVA